MPEQPVTEAQVLAALARVHDPERLQSVVALNLVRNVKICDGNVAFDLALVGPPSPQKGQLAEMCRRAVAAIPGVTSVNIKPVGSVPIPGAASDLIPGVRHVIAVGSGKGGVGKSTVAVNLAASLVLEEARVGLLDADVYGPSVPTMMGGQEDRPVPIGEERMQAPERHGIKLMSMGFLMPDATTPVMWRGPMISSAVKEMLGKVDWGELDYLIVDLPPGTGDVPLTLAQAIPLTGVVVVMTSQDVAVNIATKALHFFQRLNVPILGIVENMGAFVCPHCQTVTPIFSRGGGEQRATELGVPFLGSVPLDARIVEHGDEGVPTVIAAAESPQAQAFRAIARNVIAQVEEADAGAPVIQVVQRS
jgi:ATP-binding protein involved in chromosome partitioning